MIGSYFGQLVNFVKGLGLFVDLYDKYNPVLSKDSLSDEVDNVRFHN